MGIFDGLEQEDMQIVETAILATDAKWRVVSRTRLERLTAMR